MVFIHPRRVYHNGLVKGPDDLEEEEQFGCTVTVDRTPMIVDLYDDPRKAPVSLQNGPFKRWAAALDHWEERAPITFKRVAA